VGIQASALVALGAAASWGGGDFSGGMGVKAVGGATPPGQTRGALRVVLLAHAMSFVVLVGILLLRGEAWPHGAPLLWGLAGGVTGGLSLTAFYMALSRGEMGVSAAISGLLAAAIPAAVSMAMEGVPGAMKLVGFALAFVAIWVIAAGPSPENAGGRATLGLAVFGGVGFGIYFVALRMANPLGVMMPMAVARAASLVTCGGILLTMGKGSADGLNAVRSWWMWAVGVAVLDTGGNLLFIAATRMGRLDVASVLASLYPAGTILLAAWRLKEKPTRRQGLGMVVALAAVVMITL